MEAKIRLRRIAEYGLLMTSKGHKLQNFSPSSFYCHKPNTVEPIELFLSYDVNFGTDKSCHGSTAVAEGKLPCFKPLSLAMKKRSVTGQEVSRLDEMEFKIVIPILSSTIFLSCSALELLAVLMQTAGGACVSLRQSSELAPATYLKRVGCGLGVFGLQILMIGRKLSPSPRWMFPIR